MSFDKLPISVFDLILVAVLVLGVVRGRKHGMSEELMLLLQWLCVVVGCAFIYEPAGRMLAQSSPFSLLASFLAVYLAGGMLILTLFALVKRQLGGKLLGSDIFGRAEYYLGMCSGLIRVSCMLMAVLALLNARYFSPMEVRAMENFQNEAYGSNFFPTWHSAQRMVFEQSFTGSWIRKNLAFFLIKPTGAENKQYHQSEFAVP